VKRAWKLFIDFWVDFLIGDAPEFLFVTAAVVVLAYVFAGIKVAGVIILPLLVACSVAVSAWRVRRR